MVSFRTISLSVSGSSISRFAAAGCPQGGVLSPFLWNLVLDSLLTEFSTANAFIQAFADDLPLVLSGVDVSVLRCMAQQQLIRCQQWCRSKGLTLSSIKTVIVLFTRKHKAGSSHSLWLDDICIPLNPSGRYFGVTLDASLS